MAITWSLPGNVCASLLSCGWLRGESQVMFPVAPLCLCGLDLKDEHNWLCYGSSRLSFICTTKHVRFLGYLYLVQSSLHIINLRDS